MPYFPGFRYVFASFVLLLLSFNLVRATLINLNGGKRLDDLRAEVALLKEKKRSLEEEIAYKKTDEYIEEVARNDLNLIKPGEKVVVMNEDVVSLEKEIPEDPNEVLAARDLQPVFKPNWYLWFRLFF